MRTFVALEGSTEAHAAWVALASEVRALPSAPKASWTAPDRFHVTLVFLGATDEAHVPVLGERLARAAQDAPAPGEPPPPHQQRIPVTFFR